MANNYLDQLKLPNNSIYYLRDNEAIGSLTRTGSSLIVANRVGTQTVIPNTDFDTINVTELNAGNLIVTGAARFLNPINGSITGQAGSVANSLIIQLNSGTTEGTNKFTYNGSSAKTVNITKSGIGLSNVENKSSATIRSEITSSNVTTALGYTPLNKAGDTMTGPLKFGDQAIPQFSGSPSYILGIEAFASGGDVKWQNVSSIKVGSATKDGNGNVIADYYVKKSGDTMSGLLTTQAGITTNASLVLQKPDDVEWSLNGNNGEPAVEMNGAGDNAFKFKFTQYGTNVDVGWDWAAVAGSGAFFRQADSPSSPGYFGFFARNSSGTSQLMGSPSGVLTWANRRVVTSTNNTAVGTATQPVYVDANGYIVAGTALQGGAYKAVSTTVTQNDANLITSGAVYTAIANLPEPMVFKGTLGTGGTITALPTASASNEGYTYKVITAGTYASQSAKVGDLFVCSETSSGVYSWVIIPAGDTDSDTWRNIKVDGTEKLSTDISSGLIDFTSGNHIALSFNATGNKLTIAHADTSSQASVSNSGRTYIQSITLDGDGHVTKLTSATETVTDTNYYHKTGTWSGLTYTAAKVGSPDDLAFTIPTGTTATTVALGNHNHDGTYLKLSGGTMTGQLHFTSSAPLVYDWVHTTESPMIILKDSPNYGIRYQEGNTDTMKFSASGNANTNNADLCINGAGDGTVTIRGNTIIHAGNYTSYTVKKDGTGASGTWGISITGNAATATSATNADKVDGYHMYYDRYVSSTQLSQPTADTIWYVKVSTANWNSNIEVIQIRTSGNNRTGSHVLYTGSRGTKWWGYGQVYTHRGLSGVYKVISNSDDVYLRFDADCTSATIYTSFTPQTLAIVDSPSDANYTEVPTYGGWYGNQITVDHIQTNNYITIQKKTVASNTFADTNPKIVFKNVDGSQNGSLTWCDYDSVQYPASLTLNGNQGGEYFIAPNIKATGSFYGNLSGTASHSNALNLIASNEIRFGNRPSSAVDVYFNYQWADGTASAMINKYVFMNGNKTKCPVEASKFIGPLQGNADTATKASQDESGNNIKATYASSFSISDHTITLKNKNGDSLGTVTVPDNNTTYGLSASNDNITLTAGGTGTTVQAHLCYNIAIGNTTDWDTLQNAGAYKVQMASWGDATTYHSPNSYNSNLYQFGMLYVVKSGVSAENRIFQYYIPHSTAYPTLVRSHNSSSWSSGWSAWYPIYNGMTLAKETIGSASAGTAISADDITAWDAGSTPTLGTAISADDITAWSAGTMFSASFDGKCTLTLTSGSVPTLSYTGRTIPNVTSVGSVPTLSYTARSIPNISVSSKTVVTGIS